MNPDTKRQSPHGWYQERTKRPSRAVRAARASAPPIAHAAPPAAPLPAPAESDAVHVPTAKATSFDAFQSPPPPAHEGDAPPVSARPSLLRLCQAIPPGRLHRPTVMRWIGQGANIHITDGSGLTALMLIAQRGDLELVRYLVGQGMRVNASDSGGFTALAWAAWYDHREVVRYLKSRGATINVPAALFAAARQGRVTTLQLLQQVGARLRCGAMAHGDTAVGGHAPVSDSTLLAHAAAHGQLGTVQFLLEDPDATSIRDRLRAMHVAIEAGHYRVASLLETGRDRPYLHILRHVQWMLRRKQRSEPRAH